MVESNINVIEIGLNLKLVDISCFFTDSAVNSFHGLMKIIFSSVIISVFLKSRSGLNQKSNSISYGFCNTDI